MGNGHMRTPDEQTDRYTSENITFQQLRWRALKYINTLVLIKLFRSIWMFVGLE